MSDETRLIHAGKVAGALAKTVGPPIQKGSTVLLPNAEALYDDANHLTYGRAGLAAQAALQDALGALEAPPASLCTRPGSPPCPGRSWPC